MKRPRQRVNAGRAGEPKSANHDMKSKPRTLEQGNTPADKRQLDSLNTLNTPRAKHRPSYNPVVTDDQLASMHEAADLPSATEQELRAKCAAMEAAWKSMCVGVSKYMAEELDRAAAFGHPSMNDHGLFIQASLRATRSLNMPDARCYLAGLVELLGESEEAAEIRMALVHLDASDRQLQVLITPGQPA